MNPNDRLAKAGIELSTPPAPAANYVPFVASNGFVFVSGQVTMGPNGIEYIGKLGREFSIEQGQAAARLCAVNVLAQLNVAIGGDWNRLVQCVRLGGFVNCTAEFVDHPKVINGASDLMVEILGDRGRHARAAVGVSSLPFDVATEVEAVFTVTG